MNQNILEVPFWKVAARFTVSFLLLLTLVLTGATYFRFGNLDAINNSIADGTWTKFIFIRVALGIVYGIAMTYFTRKREKKAQGNRHNG
ncbi:hypothetical protein [Flavicella sp.]|uniref:hypothetical protein n=1 Tax=Flavicella sp. TaxID=2957742 RepID=UPI003017265C